MSNSAYRTLYYTHDPVTKINGYVYCKGRNTVGRYCSEPVDSPIESSDYESVQAMLDAHVHLVEFSGYTPGEILRWLEN